jgi:MinD superfamily P-loop ATPase
LNKINFGEGLLNIGEPSGVKVIRELKEFSNKINVQILDSPPGASCSVVETLRGVDYAILVTEPTPFGLHDLKSAQEIAENMGIKHGVVINRYEEEYDEMNKFLEGKNVDILQKIPFSREIAEIYSRGELISDKKEYVDLFKEIAEKVGVLNV